MKESYLESANMELAPTFIALHKVNQALRSAECQQIMNLLLWQVYGILYNDRQKFLDHVILPVS